MSAEKKKIDFKFEHFNTANTEELIDIYEKCFGKKPDANYFQWKLNDNPAGKAEAFVALDGQTIAGFYGVIPEEYLVAGKKMTFYQSMDTMTHPDYRRMGLFTNLAKATYQYLINRDGTTQIIGFPGLTSHPGFVKKLGWADAMAVRFFFLPRAIFKMRTLLKGKSGLTVEPFERFDEEFVRYFAGCPAPTKSITKFIDVPTLNWRYFDGPLLNFQGVRFRHNGQLIGFVIFKVEESNRGFLQFIHTSGTQYKQAVIHETLNYIFQHHNCPSIYVFESNVDSLQRAFRKNGFLHNPMKKGPFSYRPPIILYSNTEEVNGVRFFDIRKWEVQAVLRDY